MGGRWMHKSVRTKPSLDRFQMAVQSHNNSAVDASHVPSWEQLVSSPHTRSRGTEGCCQSALGLLTAIPMIGFGFVDNMIMVRDGGGLRRC